jgi:hypothetical protein
LAIRFWLYVRALSPLAPLPSVDDRPFSDTTTSTPPVLSIASKRLVYVSPFAGSATVVELGWNSPCS